MGLGNFNSFPGSVWEPMSLLLCQDLRKKWSTPLLVVVRCALRTLHMAVIRKSCLPRKAIGKVGGRAWEQVTKLEAKPPDPRYQAEPGNK
ncbi:MAG: hypothetical protein EAZ60_27705 [Oscillatoriales cyanobacterium]|nr:MAG: hypothetical protein EAZ79_18335 [Oscillatoriales cyanobacterium]TAF50846.1 MAG: hypothetical protein EAZ60_27705 [Oscillatoriales cyanobacterium]